MRKRVALLVAVLIGGLLPLVVSDVPARAAGPGEYSPPEWLPLRENARVNCVRTNCAGPYHGYWAIDFLDPANQEGDPIHPAGAGQVTIISESSQCGGEGTPGNYLSVNHSGGVVSYYFHFKDIFVDNGDWVDPNTVLGIMGSTGYNDPCPTNHLHYELRVGGVRVDPGPLKACHGNTLVTYPDVGGTTDWNAAKGVVVHSDGIACGGSGPVDKPTTTSVSASPNPSTYGQAVTISATVTSSATPTGQVNFTVDGAASSVNLSNGTASFTRSDLGVGTHTISAAYPGATGFAASGPVNTTLTVNKAPTTTTVTGSPEPSVYGQPFVLRATVAAPGTSFTPAGTVQFSFRGTPLGGPVTLVNGVATSTAPQTPATAANALAPGSYAMTATYSGSGNFEVSSGNGTHVVNKAPTTARATANPDPSRFGEAVTFRVDVAPSTPGSFGRPPSGTAVLGVDGQTRAQLALTSGRASLRVDGGLPPGSHTLTAAHPGDSYYLPATSSPTTITVRCDRNLTGTIRGNVYVDRGSTCFDHADVRGTVEVRPGAHVSVQSSTLTGNVNGNRAGLVRICGSTLNDANVTNSSRFVLIGGRPNDLCEPNTLRGLRLNQNRRGVIATGNQVQSVSNWFNGGAGPWPDQGQTVIQDASPRRAGPAISPKAPR